tara:strand:+ start:155 stop:634 length:480 start_codon:yes stop_codon:yes gene_type:complete
MQKLLNAKFFYLLIVLISGLILLAAYYIEYVLNEDPCKLCIYQRIPYFAGIFFCLLGLFYKNKIVFLYLVIFTFFISFILSGYHVGIENEIFQEFPGCTSNKMDLIEKEEILNSLNKLSLSCKNVNFKLFGFTLATLNVFTSFFIIIFSLIIYKNEKNK